MVTKVVRDTPRGPVHERRQPLKDVFHSIILPGVPAFTLFVLVVSALMLSAQGVSAQEISVQAQRDFHVG